MKKTTTLMLLTALLLTVTGNAQQLASWTGAPTSAAAATWPPTTTAGNVTISAFTKGAGIGGNSLAGGSWGGSGGWSTTPMGTSTDGTLYFTVKAATGYIVSLASIPTFFTRRSGQGPQNAMVLYSLNGGPFTAITTISTTAQSGSGNNSTNATLGNLTAIAALQNVPSTTTITIRVVPINGANNWYIMYSGGGFILNGTVSNAPLPVTLGSFTADRQQDRVGLAWETSFENNVSHFEIEKSRDALSFTKIGKVPAANNKSGSRYTYTDQAAGVEAYYRLRTVDKDGTYEYSKVVAVSGTVATAATARLLQNPVGQRLSLHLAAKSRYLIADLKGTMLQTGEVTPESNAIDVSALAKGLYLLRLETQGSSKTLKFIKD